MTLHAGTIYMLYTAMLSRGLEIPRYHTMHVCVRLCVCARACTHTVTRGAHTTTTPADDTVRYANDSFQAVACRWWEPGAGGERRDVCHTYIRLSPLALCYVIYLHVITIQSHLAILGDTTITNTHIYTHSIQDIHTAVYLINQCYFQTPTPRLFGERL